MAGYQHTSPKVPGIKQKDVKVALYVAVVLKLGGNRLKFLYYDITELWGHVRKAQSGNGKTGVSGVGVQKANPLNNPKT